ncbi:uncharacterized protein ARMOST_16205 [Armillaria ostoyae]|uniref:Uncharacterized protein n=1 Tax=Armillaria ostoyae TaxID=47428 RepID=A0A284RVJ8_ARMOS|nr:uncharacterized protein ARMOST_16205 [Armillaria ostoyae]
MPIDLDPAPNDDTFFAMPLLHNRVNVPLPENACHGFFDANSFSPKVPVAAPNQSYHEYTLHKPNGPLCRDIIEEDNESEDVLENNALAALGAIPIEVTVEILVPRFVNRSLQFMDAYARGLNGRQAAWAA